MIQVNALKKQFGQRTLFENVTFNVNPRERIGLVGRNGTGKSTLFKMLLGIETPDEGEVVVPKGYRIGTLEQHLKFTEPTIVAECATALPADKEYEVYRAEKILSGLGFTEADFERSPDDFSGGYQIRINLAKVLLTEPQMLLLDEPTNYLDIVSMRWLKTVLKTFPGEVILITHDRDFMDDVVTHTMGINRGQVKKIEGNTGKYYEQIVLEDEIYEKTRKNVEKKKKDLQQFVDRFRAQASKASQAQSKLKQLEKMDDMEALSEDSDMNLRFEYKDCPGKFPLKVEDLTFGHTESEPLFQNLTFGLAKGERLGIIGKNGKGKSTLLNVLAGELRPWSGKLTWHPSAVFGHFGQTNVLRLDLSNTIEQEVTAANPKLSPTQIRGICGAMLFTGDDAKKKISVLSGGERARVLLGKILARPSNVLFLDEPTNHLDMESIEILMDELQNYPGAVVVVTHSERMLKRLTKNLVVFKEGGAEYFNGGYEDFLRRVGWEEEGEGPSGHHQLGYELKPQKQNHKLSRKEYKKLRSQLVKDRSDTLKPLKKKVEEVEAKILDLETKKEDLSKKLIQISQKGGSSEAAGISQELGEIEGELEIFYEDFERFSTELVDTEEDFDVQLEELDKKL